jgi:cytochrome c-type protein NapB
MLGKKTFIAGAFLVTFIIAGCAVDSTYNDNEIGLRKTNLFSEDSTVAAKTSYTKAAPGEAKVYQRSFENAPPLIPHSVEGLVPITAENNSCLSCHDPAVAQAVNATAIPKSHLASFRPITAIAADGNIEKEGKEVKNTVDVKTAMHKRAGLSMERYNCTQCHVPQSDNKPLVKNEFTPDFRTKDGAKRSNLIKILNEGVE